MSSTPHYMLYGKTGYHGGLSFADEDEAIAEAERTAADDWAGVVWVEKTETIWTNTPKVRDQYPKLGELLPKEWGGAEFKIPERFEFVKPMTDEQIRSVIKTPMVNQIPNVNEVSIPLTRCPTCGGFKNRNEEYKTIGEITPSIMYCRDAFHHDAPDTRRVHLSIQWLVQTDEPVTMCGIKNPVLSTHTLAQIDCPECLGKVKRAFYDHT